MRKDLSNGGNIGAAAGNSQLSSERAKKAGIEQDAVVSGGSPKPGPVQADRLTLGAPLQKINRHVYRDRMNPCGKLRRTAEPSQGTVDFVQTS